VNECSRGQQGPRAAPSWEKTYLVTIFAPNCNKMSTPNTNGIAFPREQQLLRDRQRAWPGCPEGGKNLDLLLSTGETLQCTHANIAALFCEPYYTCNYTQRLESPRHSHSIPFVQSPSGFLLPVPPGHTFPTR
jgi:hypothetical protein